MNHKKRFRRSALSRGTANRRPIRPGSPGWAAQQKRYRQKHKATASNQERAERRAREMLYRARCRAKKLRVRFDLKLSDLEFPERCPILNVKLRYRESRGRHPDSPSLDRLDPRGGYVPGNVAVISSRANTAKSNLTPLQLWLLAQYSIGVLRPRILYRFGR